ncbi:MAG: flagellar assembly regulator FliX [Pseudolabrys sp.]|nr:flagellar assembly regulator FliX [Pseudolabrys sp.]
MRIYGTNGAALAAAPKTARRAASGAFSLNEPDDAARAGAAAPLRAVASLEALIALQGVEDPLARRRRAVARGRTALDALDALKLGLLDGTVDAATLARLKRAGQGLTEATGDALLDAVMREIDLRVAVELAKAGID